MKVKTYHGDFTGGWIGVIEHKGKTLYIHEAHTIEAIERKIKEFLKNA